MLQQATDSQWNEDDRFALMEQEGIPDFSSRKLKIFQVRVQGTYLFTGWVKLWMNKLFPFWILKFLEALRCKTNKNITLKWQWEETVLSHADMMPIMFDCNLQFEFICNLHTTTAAIWGSITSIAMFVWHRKRCQLVLHCCSVNVPFKVKAFSWLNERDKEPSSDHCFYCVKKSG